MTPRARPDGGRARACAACDAQLAADQRWCLACGARVAGAGPAALLAPLAARHLAGSATTPPSAGAAPAAARPLAGVGGATTPAQPLADVGGGATPARPLAGVGGAAPSATQPLGAAAADAARAAQLVRRRRAAAPLALAALVGVLVAGAGASTAPAGLSQQPFTVVLPPLAQVAQPVADEPPPAEEAPLDDTFADEPLDETPFADETPVAEEPADEEPAEDEPAGGDDEAPADASPVKHVFLVVLASTDVAALAAEEAKAPYLAGTLAKSGTLLTGYRAVARGSLANRIALVSGQGPTQQTLADCPPAAGAAPAPVTPADPLADGQTGGDGCLYGFETGTIADQLKGAGRTWRAYLEPAAGTASAGDAAPDHAAPAARAAAACLPEAATSRRNPFVWFRGHAEADDCARSNAPLAQLTRDLEDPETTPALSFIASDAQSGSAEADAFLERVVPQIQNSLAYADGGLIVITSDQPPAAAPTPAPAPAPPAPPTLDPPATAPAPPAQTTPEPAPTTTTEPPPPPTTTAPQPPAATVAAATPPTTPWPAAYPNVGDAAAAGAGATVGALLISPFTPAGRRDATPASHFTLLRTLSGFFALDPLGYAAADNVAPLPDALFDAAP